MDCLLLGLEGCQYVVGVILNTKSVIGLPSSLPFGRGSTNTFDILHLVRVKKTWSKKVLRASCENCRF